MTLLNKITCLFIILFLFSCYDSKYNYKIFGKVNTKEGIKDGIWYTDTVLFNADTAFYINSDNSIVKIYPPFIIKKLK